MPADAQQLLLQLAVGGERARVHDPVDAPIDHDRDLVGDRGRDPDVLLDDEDGEILLVGETDQEIPHLGHDHRREAFGRLVHHKKPRIAEQRPRDRQHLLFAARQLAAAVRAPLGQARKDRIDPFDRPVAPAPGR